LSSNIILIDGSSNHYNRKWKEQDEQKGGGPAVEGHQADGDTDQRTIATLGRLDGSGKVTGVEVWWCLWVQTREFGVDGIASARPGTDTCRDNYEYEYDDRYDCCCGTNGQ
jgi:hypothetical protein